MAPQILEDNWRKWTDEYRRAVADRLSDPSAPPVPERWRHPDIREALSVETDEKCAYCEAFVDDVSYPHVEHILPKTSRPDLVVVWTNLTRACPRCNVNKGDYYIEEVLLVNPYEDDPSNHMKIDGALITWIPGDPRGRATVLILRLHRYGLTKSRTKLLLGIRDSVEAWHLESDGPLKDALANDLRERATRGEFSAFVAALLTGLGFPL